MAKKITVKEIQKIVDNNELKGKVLIHNKNIRIEFDDILSKDDNKKLSNVEEDLTHLVRCSFETDDNGYFCEIEFNEPVTLNESNEIYDNQRNGYEEIDVVFSASTKGGKYTIEVYQSEYDKKHNSYSYSTYKNGRSDGSGSGYKTLESIKKRIKSMIDDSKEIDGITYNTNVDKININESGNDKISLSKIKEMIDESGLDCSVKLMDENENLVLTFKTVPLRDRIKEFLYKKLQKLTYFDEEWSDDSKTLTLSFGGNQVLNENLDSNYEELGKLQSFMFGFVPDSRKKLEEFFKNPDGLSKSIHQGFKLFAIKVENSGFHQMHVLGDEDLIKDENNFKKEISGKAKIIATSIYPTEKIEMINESNDKNKETKESAELEQILRARNVYDSEESTPEQKAKAKKFLDSKKNKINESSFEKNQNYEIETWEEFEKLFGEFANNEELTPLVNWFSDGGVLLINILNVEATTRSGLQVGIDFNHGNSRLENQAMIYDLLIRYFKDSEPLKIYENSNKISKEDVESVAKDIKKTLTDKQIKEIISGHESACKQDEDGDWRQVVEQQIYDIENIDESRKEDVEYVEKETKKVLSKVTAKLSAQKSSGATKLIRRYNEIEASVEQLKQEKDKLNQDLKEYSEDFFNLEDKVLTRVIETASYTMTLSAEVEKTITTTTVDNAKIISDLQERLADTLPNIKEIIDEITKKYTTITTETKKTETRLSTKMNEGLVDEMVNFIKKTYNSFLSWVNKKLDSFDNDFAKIQSDFAKVISESLITKNSITETILTNVIKTNTSKQNIIRTLNEIKISSLFKNNEKLQNSFVLGINYVKNLNESFISNKKIYENLSGYNVYKKTIGEDKIAYLIFKSLKDKNERIWQFTYDKIDKDSIANEQSTDVWSGKLDLKKYEKSSTSELPTDVVDNFNEMWSDGKMENEFKTKKKLNESSLKSFKTVEEFQKYVRKNKTIDSVEIGDENFVMDFYDSEGKEITYKGDKKSQLYVTTKDRYKSGFGDAEIELIQNYYESLNESIIQLQQDSDEKIKISLPEETILNQFKKYFNKKKDVEMKDVYGIGSVDYNKFVKFLSQNFTFTKVSESKTIKLQSGYNSFKEFNDYSDTHKAFDLLNKSVNNKYKDRKEMWNDNPTISNTTPNDIEIINESNSGTYYAIGYCGSIGGHGEYKNESGKNSYRNFNDAYKDAEKFLKQELKANKDSEIQDKTIMIDVSGDGDDFAILLMTKQYLNSVSENYFKDKEAYNSWKQVAEKVLETGKPQKGNYSTGLNESKDYNYEIHYSDGIRQMTGANSESGAIRKSKELIKNNKNIREISIFKNGSGFHSTTQFEYLVGWYSNGSSYWKNVSLEDDKVKEKELNLNESFVDDGIIDSIDEYKKQKFRNKYLKKVNESDEVNAFYPFAKTNSDFITIFSFDGKEYKATRKNEFFKDGKIIEFSEYNRALDNAKDEYKKKNIDESKKQKFREKYSKINESEKNSRKKWNDFFEKFKGHISIDELTKNLKGDLISQFEADNETEYNEAVDYLKSNDISFIQNTINKKRGLIFFNKETINEFLDNTNFIQIAKDSKTLDKFKSKMSDSLKVLGEDDYQSNLEKVAKRLDIDLDGSEDDIKQIYDIVKSLNESLLTDSGYKIVQDKKTGLYGLENSDGELVIEKEYSYIDDSISANCMVMTKDEKGDKKLIELSESRLTLKRQYTDKHPKIQANSNVKLRNKILSFITESGKSLEDFRTFCNTLNEDEEIGKIPNVSWIYKNKHLISLKEENGTKTLKLTKNGLAILNYLNKKLNEDKNSIEYYYFDNKGFVFYSENELKTNEKVAELLNISIEKLNSFIEKSMKNKKFKDGSFGHIDKKTIELNESENDKKEVAKITVDGYNYWVVKGWDSTHCAVLNNEEATKGNNDFGVGHIQQYSSEPYFNDVKSWLKGGESPDGKVYGKVNEEKSGQSLEEYSNSKGYNSKIKVGEKYFDKRYNDFYTIEKMISVESGDVDVTLKYDEGKTRTDSGNSILYYIDAKQHSLSKVNEGYNDKKEVARITVDGYCYWVVNIDSTHCQITNSEKIANGGGTSLGVGHIQQYSDEPYFDDVKKWLKGGESPDGKVYGKIDESLNSQEKIEYDSLWHQIQSSDDSWKKNNKEEFDKMVSRFKELNSKSDKPNQLNESKYSYVIDKDERGEFSASVVDKDDKVIFEFSNDENGVVDLIEDGFMKHTTDVDGLEKYLKQMKVIKSGDSINISESTENDKSKYINYIKKYGSKHNVDTSSVDSLDISKLINESDLDVSDKTITDEIIDNILKDKDKDEVDAIINKEKLEDKTEENNPLNEDEFPMNGKRTTIKGTIQEIYDKVKSYKNYKGLLSFPRNGYKEVVQGTKDWIENWIEDYLPEYGNTQGELTLLTRFINENNNSIIIKKKDNEEYLTYNDNNTSLNGGYSFTHNKNSAIIFKSKKEALEKIEKYQLNFHLMAELEVISESEKVISILTKDNKINNYPNFSEDEVIKFLTKKGMVQVFKKEDIKDNYDFFILK